MKREEILDLYVSNHEVIATYIESLESQIKELTERLIILEACLNQNSQNSSKLPSTQAVSKLKPFLQLGMDNVYFKCREDIFPNFRYKFTL
jgi:hypothetical protein